VVGQKKANPSPANDRIMMTSFTDLQKARENVAVKLIRTATA